MPVDTDPLFAASLQLATLRDEIAQHYTAITYGDSDDDSWGNNTLTTGIVLTAVDEHPDCCLAHELLHLRLQSRGYRRIRRGISSFDDTGWLGQFVTALDNELQHHRMFPKYIEMGFNPQHFYASSDENAADGLEAVLANPARDIKDIVLGYLTCIAPGGHMPAAKAAQFNQRFHEDRNGEYHDRLAAIDTAFEAWRNAGHTLNTEQVVRHIMLALENPTTTWFGYGRILAFPENGFFVGQHFQMG